MLVYAEDPITRVRQSVLTPTGAEQPLGAFPTGLVLANGRFPEIRFRPPFATEKYAVVYHGRRLGPPHVEEPANGSIGAVMAQVLGGPRAEAIVRQGEARLLRSVSGTFALPTSRPAVSSSSSGAISTITSSEPPPRPSPRRGLAPEQVKLFRVDRAVGSVDVPLLPDADPSLVRTTLLKAVAFPYGLDLGTTVDYTQRVRVRQPVVTYDRAQTWQWQEETQGYKLVADSVGSPSLQAPGGRDRDVCAAVPRRPRPRAPLRGFSRDTAALLVAGGGDRPRPPRSTPGRRGGSALPARRCRSGRRAQGPQSGLQLARAARSLRRQRRLPGGRADRPHRRGAGRGPRQHRDTAVRTRVHRARRGLAAARRARRLHLHRRSRRRHPDALSRRRVPQRRPGVSDRT